MFIRCLCKCSTATEETATDTAAAGDDKDSEKSSDDEDHPKFTVCLYMSEPVLDQSLYVTVNIAGCSS
jgi:hypothetical protein